MAKIAVTTQTAEPGIVRNRGILVLLLLATSIAPAERLQAQTADSAESMFSWRQFVDGKETAWPFAENQMIGDTDSTLDQLLHWYRDRGYYEAEVDSVHYDSLQASVWIDRGIQVTVGEIVLTGVRQFIPQQLVAAFETRRGEVLEVPILERDIDVMLGKYDGKGYVLASAQVVRVVPSETDSSQLDVVIQVDEGPLLELGGIDIPEGARTRPDFVSRATGLRVGKPLTGYDPHDIAERLEATGLFTEVDSVRLAVDENQRVIVRIGLKEEPPGAFDALVGYLPNAGTSGGGAVVGDVNILLRHVLGGGRSFAFRFRKNPGSVTRVNVSAEDPFIFGLPLRLAGHFDGLQQDSTYDTRSYGLEGGYRIQRLQLIANTNWELSRPGSAKSSAVPSSDSWWVGVGFSYTRLDRPSSPRRGFSVESNVENGRKERETVRQQAGSVSERVIETVFQQRLRASARLFMPVMLRHVAMIGFDTRAIQSRTYDLADLIRFGGANSMRGYNEDQFRGSLTIRMLNEWRFLLERSSFLFAFVDVGYVNLPEVNTVNPAERVAEEWLVGYGAGLQLRTEAGLFTMSLAFNGDEGLDAKVHLGMTLGL